MDRILWSLRQFQPDRKTFEIIAVALMVTTAVLFYGFKGERQIISVDSAKGESTVTSTTTTTTENQKAEGGSAVAFLYVDVDGAVHDPGVYKLEEGARAFEAIEKAGGLTKKADTSSLNLAEKVKDGQKLMVPKKSAQNNNAPVGESAAGTADGSRGTGSESAAGVGGVDAGGRININSASSEELQTINGIGPATAQKIIDYRNTNGRFTAPEDLKNVSGIGDKTFEKMRPYVGV